MHGFGANRGEGLVGVRKGRRVEAHRRPLGVIGAIIPWNFPLLILAFKLPPALLAGNTLVVKPAPTTPLASLKFAELVADILPKGVLNFITDANDLGDALTHHPDVRKISFTGSTATGKKVMASAAETLKRITLELGGNDAGVVLDDAKPEAVAKGIIVLSLGLAVSWAASAGLRALLPRLRSHLGSRGTMLQQRR